MTPVCVRGRALKVGCGLRGALGSGEPCLPWLEEEPPFPARAFTPPPRSSATETWLQSTLPRGAAHSDPWRSATERRVRPALPASGLFAQLRARGWRFACGTPCPRRHMAYSCALSALLCMGVRLTRLEAGAARSGGLGQAQACRCVTRALRRPPRCSHAAYSARSALAGARIAQGRRRLRCHARAQMARRSTQAGADAQKAAAQISPRVRLGRRERAGWRR
jgi:hypothetical protein